MSASAAQIQANQANSAKSTGPKTVEGKEKSRQNSLKHGLTGAGVVLPIETAAEVQWRYESFCFELQPSTAIISHTMLRRAATLAVRMEKCSERETTNSTERVIQAMVEFVAPEGTDATEVVRLRSEAGRFAAFDSSREACLARRYEADAERGFFRAMKEFRLIEKEVKAVDPTAQAAKFQSELGSFLKTSRLDDEFDALYPEMAKPSPKKPFDPFLEADLLLAGGAVDVPISIGRSR